MLHQNVYIFNIILFPDIYFQQIRMHKLFTKLEFDGYSIFDLYNLECCKIDYTTGSMLRTSNFHLINSK